MELVQIPAINGLGKTRGSENAPEKICFNFEKSEKIRVNNENIEEQQEQIYENAKRILKTSKPIFIGGDHSISYPTTKAFLEKYENPLLIILDAHPDLMPPMQNPTHEEWLRALIEQGFSKKDILLIGARNIDSEERRYIEKEKIKTFPIKNPEEIIKEINTFAKNKNIYLSLDMDVFDSSVISATGYPEKGGFTKEQGMKILEELSELNIKAMDIVEINPEKQNSEFAISLAIKIIKLFKNKI